ncbi:hypothetical protein LCGC14_2087410 [marine sediment metagenome]|uniref:Uncharacterized protein n=1 Tax=marine sediment metagenome TaxID=412755 RepID=A0A0F9HAR1_9ZZZZ|nr:hypothetical protein [Candidatus Aminicenantes bacterium]
MSSPFKRGDFFCTVNPKKVVGKSIAVVQKYRTIGMLSKATHSGVFLDENTVFESQWRVEQNNVWDSYEGVDFLAGRWKGMTDEKFDKAWEELKKLEGKFYPAPRLVMFLLTPMLTQLISPMKYIGLGFFSPIICSEVAGLSQKLCGFPVFDEYMGMMPARVANIIRRDKDVEIIHPKAPLRRLK